MKPETRLIKVIHDKLTQEIYREKMSNMYTSGTWDVYYEGHGKIFWVEYKYIQMPQLKTDFLKKSSKTALTAHQQAWGKRLYNNNIPGAVVLGWGVRRMRRVAVFQGLEWEEVYTRQELYSREITTVAYCDFLESMVL